MRDLLGGTARCASPAGPHCHCPACGAGVHLGLRGGVCHILAQRGEHPQDGRRASQDSQQRQAVRAAAKARVEARGGGFGPQQAHRARGLGVVRPCFWRSAGWPGGGAAVLPVAGLHPEHRPGRACPWLCSLLLCVRRLAATAPPAWARRDGTASRVEPKALTRRSCGALSLGADRSKPAGAAAEERCARLSRRVAVRPTVPPASRR